mgnify:CR=1 FL=1
MEECVEIGKELLTGLLTRMGMEATVEGFVREGDLHLEVRGDPEGVLIGRHGRTLDALQMLINRMVNKQLKSSLKVLIDINDYRKRREETLQRMALRLGEKAKRACHAVTAGPFNAHERRIIHLALKEDPSLETESLGAGEVKKMTIIPKRREE